MKKLLLASVMTLCLSGLVACAQKETRPSAPLQTDGVTTPPPGCVDLRKRGGAC